jgi:hypothetical protein
MEPLRSAYIIVVRKSEWRRPLGRQGADEKIIFQLILKE